MVMVDQQNEQPTNWRFNENLSTVEETGIDGPSPTPLQNFEPISWTASEYVSHEKGKFWYLQFVIISIVIIAITFLVTRDFVSMIILIALAIGVGFFAVRKPETLHYQIDSAGIHIGSKLYPITMFKSFAVVEEGAVKSIALMPLKRFMPAITMYFSPEDETKIRDALGKIMPEETRQQDPIDRFMRKIRF